MASADVVVDTLHSVQCGVVGMTVGFVVAGGAGVQGIASESMAPAVVEACDGWRWRGSDRGASVGSSMLHG
jgi:hypothetical protein